MNAAESSPSMNLDTIPNLVKTGPAFSGAKRSSASEPGDDIVAAGASSISEIEKLMEELGTARDYLKAEGERVRLMNARYAHLTSTASASVKIIAESMGKWRTTEIESGDGGRETPTPDDTLRSLHNGKLELGHTQARN